MTENHHDTHTNKQDKTAEDIIYVDTAQTTVSCCGEGVREGGHPRVYLPIRQGKGYVICPYCHRRFVHKTEKEAESTHG